MRDWKLCSNEMPKERESIFAKLKGTDKWDPAMFERTSDCVEVTVQRIDDSRVVRMAHTVDGKWKLDGYTEGDVIAWRVMPEPYRGAKI